MRKRAMPNMSEGNVNLTPLIDVVMCLIVFFMLIAKIGVTTGGDSNVHIPACVRGTDLHDMGNVLTVNVRNNPDPHSDEPIVTATLPDHDNPGQSRMTTLSADYSDDAMKNQSEYTLRAVLTKYVHGDPQYDTAPNPDFKVMIRGNYDLQYRYLAPVLISITMSGVKEYGFDNKRVKDLDSQPQEGEK